MSDIKQLPGNKSTLLVDDEDVIRKSLIEAIDVGMLMLGERGRHAIYLHIEKMFGVKCSDYPEEVEAFHYTLKHLLGSGSEILERTIAKRLYHRLGLDFKEYENYTIIDYVGQARIIWSLHYPI